MKTNTSGFHLRYSSRFYAHLGYSTAVPPAQYLASCTVLSWTHPNWPRSFMSFLSGVLKFPVVRSFQLDSMAWHYTTYTDVAPALPKRGGDRKGGGCGQRSLKEAMWGSWIFPQLWSPAFMREALQGWAGRRTPLLLNSYPWITVTEDLQWFRQRD